MPRAVRFDHYGGVDVLEVAEVERPPASPGRVLVRVVTAGFEATLNSRQMQRLPYGKQRKDPSRHG